MPKRYLQKLRDHWRTWRNTSHDLNRRVTVENRLWAAAAGDRPPPDANECRDLALKLGVPDSYRRD